MNPRILSQVLYTSPYKELIQHLANQWIRADRPNAGLFYSDYLTTLSTLLLTTQSLECTVAIVTAVLKQAVNLEKPPNGFSKSYSLKACSMGSTGLTSSYSSFSRQVESQINYSMPITNE